MPPPCLSNPESLVCVAEPKQQHTLAFLQEPSSSCCDVHHTRWHLHSPCKGANICFRYIAAETKVCGERASGIGNLPIEQIERTVQPNEAQRAALKELQDATAPGRRSLEIELPNLPGAHAARETGSARPMQFSNFSRSRSAGSGLALVRPMASSILPETTLPSTVVTFISAPKCSSAGNGVVV
jgi:hypothetical protein